MPGGALLVEGEVQYLADLPNLVWSGEPDEHLQAAVEVAVHQVGGADPDLGLTARFEPIGPGMLQEPADDAADADVLGQVGDTGTQRADPPDPHVDGNTGPRRPIPRVDARLVGKGVQLEPDPRRSACLVVRD